MKKLVSARVSQLLFLALFLLLFLMTEYRGSDRIVAAANGFFRANALTAASTLLAVKTYVPLLLPGLLMLVLTVFLGRFFCGWICPLGTILDLATGRIRKVGPIRSLQGNAKYWLLVPLLTASLFKINLAGLLDPIALLQRALTFFFHPLLGETVRGGWRSLYGLVGERRDLLDPGYRLIANYLLPFRETLYPLAFLSAALFFLILFLERYEERAWCRRLCPLGTLLGLATRLGPLRRVPTKLCPDCRACQDLCPTSFDRELLQMEECILCMKCAVGCPSRRVRFSLGFRGRRPDQGPVMERRVLLGGMLSGFVLVKTLGFRNPERQNRLLRPPGVRSEGEFLEKCVRCGECMKVCLRSALYPAFLQAGVEGMYTPMLVPRLGYCEYNCTLCGQVCPTGAIPDLPPAQKKREVIGKAVLDKNRCIPFARRIDCIVCEEHCPIPQKAIRSEVVEIAGFDGKTVQVKQPYVVEELCNGCGICENVCPLEGKAGIDVFAVTTRTPLAEPGYGAPDQPANQPADPYAGGNS
ncbi:4Fe-4S binding protein [Geobacter sp. SVR]|uniref:4Fe-4S binding protein n=1 Tax=Geobacter sp. SVR TaxID=2495594 RepID=UPI00143EFD6A|nr:4Fe-4S binding protein [Geobacter sp. SVR]BCS54897.1 (4Fe-4S)-binding protein [Geobacter sp. SVR]GCF87415.1 (4Fe-4S)-binding protein [Geobacter sp. SVR]